MKGIWILLAILAAGGVMFYAIGCWLLGMKVRNLFKEMTPVMYDGKEPYEQWAAKMEQARRIQAEEDARGD